MFLSSHIIYPARLPGGMVTFLFTDMESSTRRWQEYPERMPEALRRHNALLRAAIEAHKGYLFKQVGDSVYAAFENPIDALRAALEAQQALSSQDWSAIGGLRVRMAVHTGTAEFQDGDYFGVTLSRADRILDMGSGGQVLVSQVAYTLVKDYLPEGAGLQDLGLHSLPDLDEPERIYALRHPSLPTDSPALRSQSVPPNNLPVPLTSFIGRERPMADITRLLTRTRLLTLTGFGGCGKTRLALQVASELLTEYPDGVWLVEVAALSDPALLSQAVASALVLHEEPGRSVLDTVTAHLQSRTLLLLLDNCEHLLSSCAILAHSLLKACPNLRILATSREGMGLIGELTYPVPFLSLPDLRHLPPMLLLSRYEAVRLFVERAIFRQPGFTLTAQNAPMVAQICSRLEGIPLAIELAAARLNVLSVEQIARFDDHIRLLVGGDPTGLPHHETLQATLDWSYNLLPEAERTLLQRLSVFAGGWTLEATEQVTAEQGRGEWGQVPSPLSPVTSHEVLDLLARLVSASLVIAEDQAGEKRYRMLETIRQYAYGHLESLGQAGLFRERHLDCFLALSEEAVSGVRGAEQAVWLNRLETEHVNMRAALTWCLESPNRVEAGLRIVGRTLVRFWEARGHFSEGRQWCMALLAHPEAQEPTQGRADVLNAAGLLAFRQGDYPAAQAQHEQNLALCQQLGYQAGIARSLNNLGMIHLDLEQYEQARSLFEQALLLNRERDVPAAQASNLASLGIIAQRQGNLEEARRFQEEARRLHESIGNKGGLIVALINLAVTVLMQGDVECTHALLVESLALSRETGEHWTVPYALSNLAELALQQGRPERAVRLYGAEEVLREAIGLNLSPRDRQECERGVAVVRSALGEERVASFWAEGRAMTSEQAIVYALEDSLPERETDASSPQE